MDHHYPDLPLELIFHIIASLFGDPRTILRPSHPTTKTLRSLTLVCRATYPVASNYLRQRCVYIDTDRRLIDLIHCVELTNDRTQESSGRHAGLTTIIPPALSLPPGTALRHITTLYLAPFFRSSLDNQPTAIWIRELFCLIHPTLRRLIVDMPLRSLYPADDHLNVRKTLREAFSMLTSLEEFVSVRDELYLDVLEREWRTQRETEIWTLWPGLRRLALYNVAADERFWGSVRGMGDLETVVLTRADDLEEVCIKTGFLGSSAADGVDAGAGAGEGGQTTHRAAAGPNESPRRLKVVLVNVSNHQPNHLAGRWKWNEVDPGGTISVMTYDVPTSFYGDEDPIDLCQEWVKTAAVRGDIWDWEGPLVTAAQVGDETSNGQVFELEA